MGQAIVYCSNCSAQIRGSDFEARRAFRVDDLVFCKKCCREVLGYEPAPTSSTRVPAPPAPSKSSNTTRIGITPVPGTRLPRSGGGSSVGILAGVGIGAVALVIVVAIAASGRRERPEPPRPSPASAAEPPPAPRVSARELAAEEALVKAHRFAADPSHDLAAQRALFAEAVALAAGTPLHEDARRELDRVDRRLAERRMTEPAKAVPKPVEPPPATPAPAPAVRKPAPPAPPREDPAVRARWEAALAPATGRDYAASVALFEKLGEDVALLKAASSLSQEALQALVRTPKGQKVVLDYREGGDPRRIEASFAGEENGLVELRTETGTVELELGEVVPSSLVDHLRSRGGAVDPPAAAIFCLLEGDEAGARRLLGDKVVPEKYWAYARSVAASRIDSARSLYQEARALEQDFAAAADALPKLQALLRDHAETPFVRRNKASLAARAQRCAREYLFLASDLKPAGAFKAGKSAKGGACWTSDVDVDPAKPQENFIELSFSVLPDTSYRCWIYAGACCQEVFEFSVQGTEMKGGKEKEPVEPGAGPSAVVKSWLPNYKKTHASHTGPRQPAHWEWLSISLPKYAKAGSQRVRVLTDQKGFSVAYACVTAVRTNPPRELDLRELEKTRGDRSMPAVQGTRASILYACKLDGTDRGLVGELRDRALYGGTSFGACWAGVEGKPVFTMSAQGELRVTYFLNTATPLTARFRIPRGGKTIPYDAHIAPVAGRPVEVRIPFADFKSAFDKNDPPLAAGDGVPMVYFFGKDVNCGLRIDALSIVELRSDSLSPAESSKVVFSETFDKGTVKFIESEVVDGGVNGSKAYLMPPKGVSAWNAWSVPVKDSTTVSFKLKPLSDVPQIMVLVWSDGLKDNARTVLSGFKKGEWKEVRFKAADLRIGATGEGASLDHFHNIKLFLLGTPLDAKVLLDDFEIRE